ncbi:hypothetical protein LCGC14_2079390 [marine sediment metagenome]|uniref:Uncharacterized protein n=1 Tax=marine sediment metagenome TaxID=412755 RepID=A0A0F9F3E0_9ZZZZ
MSDAEYKFTEGYVRQRFEGGKCVEQRFKAVDQVHWEDGSGGLIPDPKHEDVYQPFDMVQPSGMVRPSFEALLTRIERKLDGVIDQLEKQKASGNIPDDSRSVLMGLELSDGGLIQYPDEDDKAIRRVDAHGNLEDVRRPGDEGYDEWRKLFP